jgi:hypothetical protein
MKYYYNTTIPKMGKIDHYINKPVTRSGEIIGVIVGCIEVTNGYFLSIETTKEIIDSYDKPFSFSISGGK